MDAAAEGDLPAVRGFLRRNATAVAAKDRWTGETPLHQAAVWGHPAMAEFLLAHGAKINTTDNDGPRPRTVAPRLPEVRGKVGARSRLRLDAAVFRSQKRQRRRRQGPAESRREDRHQKQRWLGASDCFNVFPALPAMPSDVF